MEGTCRGLSFEQSPSTGGLNQLNRRHVTVTRCLSVSGTLQRALTQGGGPISSHPDRRYQCQSAPQPHSIVQIGPFTYPPPPLSLLALWVLALSPGEGGGGGASAENNSMGGFCTTPPFFAVQLSMQKYFFHITETPPPFWVKGLLGPPFSTPPVGQMLPLALRIWHLWATSDPGGP